MRAMCERKDLAPGFTREVLADRVVPARWEDVHQRRNDEEDGREGCDSSRGVANDRSNSQGEDPDEQQVDRSADHRPRDSRMRERNLEKLMPGENRLAREEGDQDR